MIQDNDIENDPLMHQWLWDAIKINTTESWGVLHMGGFGNTIRRNNIHDTMNGIELNSSFYDNAERYVADTDIAENVLWDLDDDAIEPEGGNINVRIWGNRVERRTASLTQSAQSGVASAPVEVGPTWALYNTFLQTRQSAFKNRGDTTGGWLIAYHNTIYNDTPDFMALLRQWGDWSAGGVKVKFRNNLFVATGSEDNGPGDGYIWEDISGNPLGAPTIYDFDYDNLYSARVFNCGPLGPGCRFAFWGGARRNSLTALQAATGFEPHGLSVNPLFVNAAGGDFHLQSNSPVIDQGAVLPGVNQSFSGSAPDMGAFEYQVQTCVEDWQCGPFGTCVNGQQSRACVDLNLCGTTNDRPPLSQACSCIEDWQCGPWSICTNNSQDRSCTDNNACGTTNDRSPLTMSCDSTAPTAVIDFRTQ